MILLSQAPTATMKRKTFQGRVSSRVELSAPSFFRSWANSGHQTQKAMRARAQAIKGFDGRTLTSEQNLAPLTMPKGPDGSPWVPALRPALQARNRSCKGGLAPQPLPSLFRSCIGRGLARPGLAPARAAKQSLRGCSCPSLCCGGINRKA